MEKYINLLRNSKLKLVEKETGIPYDRMYKWVKGLNNPKTEDFETIKKYFDGLDIVDIPQINGENEQGVNTVFDVENTQNSEKNKNAGYIDIPFGERDRHVLKYNAGGGKEETEENNNQAGQIPSWYWKIDTMIANQIKTNDLLQILIDQLKK